MILALKCIQNFIKTYQVQEGALMYTCALSTHLHIISLHPFPTPRPPPPSLPLPPPPTPARNKILCETLYMNMTKYEFISSGKANEVSYFQVTC